MSILISNISRLKFLLYFNTVNSVLFKNNFLFFRKGLKKAIWSGQMQKKIHVSPGRPYVAGRVHRN
jgi:hypothetical protein